MHVSFGKQTPVSKIKSIATESSTARVEAKKIRPTTKHECHKVMKTDSDSDNSETDRIRRQPPGPEVSPIICSAGEVKV